MNNSKRRAQSGNILFYILIAIALLAALSLAVAQSNRGSLGQVNQERARILADELLDYGNAVSNAVAQLRLRGCKDIEISFERPGPTQVNSNAPTDKTCHVFEKVGGGILYRSFTFPSGLVRYPGFSTGTDDIPQIGLPNQADIWMRLMLDDNASSHLICSELNQSVDMAVIDDPLTTGFEPLEDGSWTDTPFIGVFPSSTVSIRPNVSGRTAWCAGHNVTLVSFYRLLMAR